MADPAQALPVPTPGSEWCEYGIYSNMGLRVVAILTAEPAPILMVEGMDDFHPHRNFMTLAEWWDWVARRGTKEVRRRKTEAPDAGQ